PCPVQNLPGRSIVPDHFEPRPFVISQCAPYYGHLERMAAVTGVTRDIAEFTAHLRSIRNDQFKFVWSSRGEHRLFDLTSDPDEQTNIIKQRSDVAVELEKTLTEWWSQQPHYVPTPRADSRALNQGQRTRLE